jgi:AcrR family transcriptional regulator
MSAMPGGARGGAPGLRADALQNRSRIVEAARRLLAERGPDVPVAVIARHAGVGVATLYRRFPTRESLVAEVLADQFAACVSVVDEALANPDPWRGFCTVIEKMCARHVSDRAFSAAVPGVIDVEEGNRATRGFAELTRHAKASGLLRADFAPEDLTLLLMANRGIVAGSAETALAASRRLVAYFLEACRADTADPARRLPPPAPLILRDVLDPPDRPLPKP